MTQLGLIISISHQTGEQGRFKMTPVPVAIWLQLQESLSWVQSLLKPRELIIQWLFLFGAMKICGINNNLYIKYYKAFKNADMGLPWWSRGWESAGQCRGQEFNPWSGKTPYATEQLSPCTATTETAFFGPRAECPRACALPQEKPLQREAGTPKLE